MVARATNRSGSSTVMWNSPNISRMRKSARRVARIAGAIRMRLMTATVSRNV